MEVTGIDTNVHAESGYDLIGGASTASGAGLIAAAGAVARGGEKEHATAGKE